MSQDEMKAAFEYLHAGVRATLPPDEQEFLDQFKVTLGNFFARGWESSRAAVVVELPPISTEVDMFDQPFEVMNPEAVIAAIEAAGLGWKS